MVHVMQDTLTGRQDVATGQEMRDVGFKVDFPVIKISEKAVNHLIIRSAIPEGYVQAGMGIVVFSYVNYPDFRQELARGPIWINQRGLETAGYKEILDDYSFATVSKSKFHKLPRNRRSFHNKGGGILTVDSGFGGGSLNIETWLNPDITARVAYIKDDNAVRTDRALALLESLKRL